MSEGQREFFQTCFAGLHERMFLVERVRWRECNNVERLQQQMLQQQQELQGLRQEVASLRQDLATLQGGVE